MDNFVNRWKGNVSGRLQNLELALGTVEKDKGIDGTSDSFHGLIERVERLETLGRMTLARTCKQLKDLGVKESGHYFIDPDGSGVGIPPVEVFCDMKSGTTRINHELKGEQQVSPCRERGCFVRAVNYAIPMKQLEAIILMSSHCEQYIRYDCKMAPLNSDNESNAWWMDRHEKLHFYWSGSGDVESYLSYEGVCYCHHQQICLTEDVKCNCDAGEEAWTYDDGQLTDRNQLPVTKLNFGNTDTEGQDARFQLGPLFCSGEEPLPLEMDSCDSLWRSTATGPGYQMIKGKDDTYPKVVYCDMDKLPGNNGFQRTFGSPGNLREFVAFDAFLEDAIEDNYRYIGFTGTLVNIGEAFDVADGIFTVPVTGSYLFSAHGMPKRNKPLNIQIHRNSQPVASFSNGKSGEAMVGQSVILEVAVGDEIRLFNSGGEIAGDQGTPDSYFHFIGVLLYSSDRM